jgi:hypothetical protein
MKRNSLIIGVIIAILIGGIIVYTTQQSKVSKPMQSTSSGHMMPDGTMMQ